MNRQGRRAAPSEDVPAGSTLIGKLRSLAVGEVNERPSFRTRRKIFPHGVLQDVIPLFLPAFFMPQPMLKEIALPFDPQCFGRPFFPLAHNEPDGFAGWPEGNQGVNMVGHKEENIRPPKPFFLPMTNGCEESRCFLSVASWFVPRTSQLMVIK
jgi:hypothetical protein